MRDLFGLRQVILLHHGIEQTSELVAVLAVFGFDCCCVEKEEGKKKKEES